MNLTPFFRLEAIDLFLLVLADVEGLDDWRRRLDIYELYRRPELDHSALIRDLQAYAEQSQVSLGPLRVAMGQPGHDGNAFFLAWDPTGARFRQSELFRRLVREGGILAWWQKRGFPVLCRPLGDNDFECD